MEFRVPFVDMPARFRAMRSELMSAIERVLSRGDLILRGDVEHFESRFSEFVGTKFAIGVGSGYDALFLALKALGVSPSDEVITVSHTCIATVSAIVNSGATPVLVDVGDDGLMDIAEVERAVTSRTKVVIAVHLDGHPCDMQKLMTFALRHDLVVIEDVAQALGGKFDGHPLGSLGRVGTFSLYPFKMLGAFGDAGMVVTDDPEVARRVRVLRNYGRDNDENAYLFFGYNSRLDNLQAAVLEVMLPCLPTWIERRREIAGAYTRRLSDIPGLFLPPQRDSRFFSVHLNYVVRTSRRDRLREHLTASGVETLISLAKPIHHHPALCLGRWALPKTDEIARTYLCLPIYPELTDSQVQYVIDSVRTFYLTQSG